MAADEIVNNSDNTATSWYELGFARSLTEPALLLGVSRTPLVLNGAFAFLMIYDFGFWPILLFSLVAHFLMIYICKSDKQFFDCLQSYIHKKSYYSV